jgi:lysophospholipase L1-like esterase
VRRLALVLATVALVAGCSSAPPEHVSHYTPTPAASQGEPVAIIGDSYTGGSPSGGKGDHGWPALVATQLQGQGEVITPAVGFEGGSGYVHPGNQRGGVFADQVPKVVQPDDRLVVLFGSTNDSKVPVEQLTPAVAGTYADVKQIAPKRRFSLSAPPT